MAKAAPSSGTPAVSTNGSRPMAWPLATSSSRVLFASTGSAYIQVAVFRSSIGTTITGSIGSRIAKLIMVCASLNDFAFIASAISNAAANRHSGIDTAITISMLGRLRRHDMPSSSSGIHFRMKWATSSSRVSPSTDTSAAAIHLPASRSNGRTGCAISNSSERRSRSPAVESIAAFIQKKNAVAKNMPSRAPAKPAERELLVAVSNCSIWIGAKVAGDTPCASRRAPAMLSL